MSFQEEARKILAELGRKCSPVATLRNVDNPLVKTEYIDQALTSIINLVDKEVIGEDENSRVEEQSSFLPKPTIDEHYRNRLKAEQRNKLRDGE